MFFLSTRRILKFSWQHFWRNIWLSVVTMTIIILTLMSLTTMILVNVIADRAVGSVKDNIDVSLYFDNKITDESVKILQKELTKIGEIRKIQYISSDEALARFKDKHKDDKNIQETIAELDQNPLGPTLVISAYNVEQYPVIMKKIKEMKLEDLAEKIDYEDHELLISRINDFADKLKKFSLILSLIFIFIAILTVFNTIRMGIYVHRREIGIMRLVGASNWFIRLPFVLEGIFYAFFGSVIFWGLVFLLLHFIGPWMNGFFTGINFDVQKYFMDNAFYVFGFEFVLIATINIISALVAMGRHLRI